jgi:hypothetical protein
MRALTDTDAQIGVRVLYGGESSARDASSSAAQRGHVLVSGHPGVIRDIHGPGKCHVVVEFVGLEHEGISPGAGWDPMPDGTYPHLLIPEMDEWDVAIQEGWWTEPMV